MYKVLKDFIDIATGTEYKEGDTYPKKGIDVTAEKIAFLSSPTSMRGALIADAGKVKDDIEALGA